MSHLCGKSEMKILETFIIQKFGFRSEGTGTDIQKMQFFFVENVEKKKNFLINSRSGDTKIQ